MMASPDADRTLAAWAREGPTRLDESVRQMIIAEAMVVPQRRRRSWFGDTDHRILWFAGGAIAASLAIAAAVVLTGELSGKPSTGDPPDATPTTTPAVVGARHAAVGFVRPFTYVIPAGSGLGVLEESAAVVTLVADPTGPADSAPYQQGARGVTIVDATDARTESGLGRADVQLRYPQFFDDLARNGSVVSIVPADAELGGYPAIQADVNGGDLPGANAYPHIHLSGSDADFLNMNYPDRLIVADVQGRVVLVHIWARDAQELSRWIPTAMQLVGSIDFESGP